MGRDLHDCKMDGEIAGRNIARLFIISFPKKMDEYLLERRTKMKIVINRCFGVYELSCEAVMYYAKLKGIKLYAYVDIGREIRPYNKKDNSRCICIHYATKEVTTSRDLNKYYFSTSHIERTDPDLIKTIEKLKKRANGPCAELAIVEIPNDIEYTIEEYDGTERIAEKHNTWS